MIAPVPDRPPLPDAFADLLAGLEEHRLPPPGDVYRRCFGCGSEHPDGLRVRWFKTADGVLSPIVIPGRFAGPPGAAHGGIIVAYLDEVMAGAAARHGGRIYVTGEIAVRYRKPVPLETPLVGRGRVTGGRGRALDLEGTLEDYRSGEVLARGRGRFVAVPGA
jgi:acyl-coenzyme A thioesterase PaaI-like protein